MSVNAVQHRGVKNNAPRRKKTKRSRFQKTIWPLIKFGVISVVIVVVGCWLITKIARPFHYLGREAREAKQKAAEYKTLRNQNTDLERRITYLKSSKGVTQAARKLGYVKPGEITLVIPEKEKSQPEGSE